MLVMRTLRLLSEKGIGVSVRKGKTAVSYTERTEKRDACGFSYTVTGSDGEVLKSLQSRELI